MPSADDLIGAWTLVSWTAMKNGEPAGYPMGEDALGQIIYSPQGRMSAFLMRADYHGNPPQTKAGSDDCIAYGGTYRIDGEEVAHDVIFATLPHWIGNPLVRTMNYNGTELRLNTKPEFSKSGNRYENELVWRKV